MRTLLTILGLLVAAIPLEATTYSTAFPATENPICEGSPCNWVNGKSTALNWSDVRTTANFAFGTESGAGGYTDSTALLTGTWGASQTVQGTVRIVNSDTANNEELEFRLRSGMSATGGIGTPCASGTPCSWGYETTWSVKPGNPYVEMAIWNGPLGSFSYVNPTNNYGCTLSGNTCVSNCGHAGGRCYAANGDVLKSTAIDNLITLYMNGEAVMQFTDNTVFPTAGAPGVGFGFFLSGGNGSDANFGFSSFTASDGPLPPSGLTAIAH